MEDQSAAERGHLSIREVLDLLVAEFEDVTISKIRFLESRGLIHPERTPSGYRKFYDADVERLRWILRQQRENFLPLKVIKGRLDQVGAVEQAVAGKLFEPEPPPPDAPPLVPVGVAALATLETPLEARAERRVTRPVLEDGGARPGDEGEPAVERAPAPLGFAASVSAGAAAGGTGHSGADALPARRPPRAARPARPASAERRTDLGPGTAMTAEELAQAIGAPLAVIAELEEFGLVESRDIAGVRCYGEDALAIARIAVALRGFGIEARHLKQFKHAAEREASLFSQVVTPLLRQRNPEARELAHRQLAELAEHGVALREAFVRVELRRLTGG